MSEYTPIWIANLVIVEAKKDFIIRMSERLDVSEIYLDYEIENIEPVAKSASSRGLIASIEEGLERINAPQAWTRGYTGAGRLVSHL